VLRAIHLALQLLCADWQQGCLSVENLIIWESTRHYLGTTAMFAACTIADCGYWAKLLCCPPGLGASFAKVECGGLRPRT
jgi:hypothetical protein